MLDYNLYVEVENLSDFLLKYPLPDFENKDIFYQTPWKDKSVSDKWTSLLLKLNKTTVVTIKNI